MPPSSLQSSLNSSRKSGHPAMPCGQIGSSASDDARWLGRDYLATLKAYEAEATQAGSSFVEIQHTMLFATVGQKVD